MKLKNKLALDSVENCGEYSHMCEKWFLKGFEAAFKAIIDKFGKTGWVDQHTSGLQYFCDEEEVESG